MYRIRTLISPIYRAVSRGNTNKHSLVQAMDTFDVKNVLCTIHEICHMYVIGTYVHEILNDK